MFTKTTRLILIVLCLLLASCEKKTDYEIGEGIEIYLTTAPYTFHYQIDYSAVDFDTVELHDTPMLRYNNILKYDTLINKMTLGISHDSLQLGDAGVYGRMFVVTVDKQPVYCGFKWRVISSVACNWIFIEEPYPELDGLYDDEIKILFGSNQKPDPRMDRRIIDRLKADEKID